MIKYSIIVPVYNVEKYLNECVESIRKQTYSHYEIILVDDGSTDTCGEICDKIGKKYNNVEVVHKSNGGLSDARNVGISLATGEYLLFCDSDDWWNDENLLAKATICINKFENPELILFSGKKFFENTQKIVWDKGLDVNRINSSEVMDILRYLVDSGTYSMSACTKIISRRFLLSNELYFTKGLLGEDLDWFIGVMLGAKSIKAIESFDYCYRIRNGSITQSVSTKYITDFLWILQRWVPIIKENVNNKNTLFGVLAYTYMINMMNLMKINKYDRKQLQQDYVKYKWLLKYSNNRRIQIVRIISNIIGIVPTAKLLKLYYDRIMQH